MHAKMLVKIKRDTEQTADYTGRSILSEKVLNAISKVPRHEFVPAELLSKSYDNRPLPIGKGQTISQPFIVALMTDFLELDKTHRVLEVGTGSGYQAAVLAELAASVYSIEIIPELAQSAKNRIRYLGYNNVEVVLGDGFAGLAEKAPFDAIIVTAASPTIPEPLLVQLKPGGRMIMPVGRQLETQFLTLVLKDGSGKLTFRKILPVSFVPLTGKGAE